MAVIAQMISDMEDPEGQVDPAKAHDRARRPESNQFNMFDPDALIPVGEKQRTRMEKGESRALITWRGVVMKVLQRARSRSSPPRCATGCPRSPTGWT
jgi:hypothetical protein